MTESKNCQALEALRSQPVQVLKKAGGRSPNTGEFSVKKLMNKNLTDRQQLVLDELIAFQHEKGFSPTTAELAQRLGFRSPNAAADHLRALHKKGVISISPGISRGIAITSMSNENTAISLLRSLVDGDEYAREHAIAFLESREVEA